MGKQRGAGSSGTSGTGRAGFTAVDLIAVVVVLGVGGVLFAHATAPARAEAMGLASMRNLSVIGQMSAMYTPDNAGALPGYSWKAGELYHVIGAPGARTYSTDSEAQAAQNTDILRRLTGRIGGPDQILGWSTRLINPRYSHLPLMDYWGLPANAPVLAAPSDRNLQVWQADPLDLSTTPYANGHPNGYDSDPNWSKPGTRQRWAYGSSYIYATVTWCPDSTPTYGPVADTPNLFSSTGGSFALGGRELDEVAFPSAKVWMYEEFEWRPRFNWGTGTWASDGLWCVYSRARSAKLMFDGSVHDRPAAGARSAWNPRNPSLPVWRQRYVPIDTFPEWVGDRDDVIDQRFRWTRDGLAGIDYVPE